MPRTISLEKLQEAAQKLSAADKVILLDSLLGSLPDEQQEDWLSRVDQTIRPGEEEDIRLAEEALEEYLADPTTAVDGDVVFKQLMEKYAPSKEIAAV